MWQANVGRVGTVKFHCSSKPFSNLKAFMIHLSNCILFQIQNLALEELRLEVML